MKTVPVARALAEPEAFRAPGVVLAVNEEHVVGVVTDPGSMSAMAHGWNLIGIERGTKFRGGW